MDNIISSLSLFVMQAFKAMADIRGIVMNLPGGRLNEGGAEMTGAQQNASVTTLAGGVGQADQASRQASPRGHSAEPSLSQGIEQAWQIVRRGRRSL